MPYKRTYFANTRQNLAPLKKKAAQRHGFRIQTFTAFPMFVAYTKSLDSGTHVVTKNHVFKIHLTPPDSGQQF